MTAEAARSSGIDPESGEWTPAFPGQRKPFPRGNTAGMVAGAYSERVIGPLAEEIAAEVLSDPYWPWLARPIMRELVREYARVRAREQVLRELTDELGWPFGDDDDEDDDSPGVPLWRRRYSAYQAWSRAYRRWITLEGKLGRFPTAEATAPKHALWRQAKAEWQKEQREQLLAKWAAERADL